MASTFKSASVDGSAITGGTQTTVYTCPGSTTGIILALNLVNLTASQTLITIIFNDNSTGGSIYLVKDLPLPARSAIEMLSGNKYILEAGDSIDYISSEDNSVDAYFGVMEQV